MKKNTGLWIGLGIGGAILFFAFTSDAGLLFPGLSVAVQGGTWAGQASPANGVVSFVLPSGGSWIAAQRTIGTGSPSALAVPIGDAPMVVSNVAANTIIALQWKDASGATATAFYGFA